MAHDIFMVKFGQRNDPAIFGSKDGFLTRKPKDGLGCHFGSPLEML